MGTSSSPADLARKFEAMITATEEATRAGTEAAALAVTTNVRTRMSAATGGDFMLSGTARITDAPGSARKYKRKERKVGARYRLIGRGAQTTAVVGATGSAQLVEGDIDRHYVFSRFARADGVRTRSRSYRDPDAPIGSKRRIRVDTRSAAKIFGVNVTGDRRAVIKFNGVVRRWTTAKSTGRHPWRNGVDASRQQVGEVWTTAHRRALVETFR